MCGGTSVSRLREDYTSTLTHSSVTASPGERTGRMPESEFIEWGVGLSVSFGRKGGGISLTNDHITQRKVRMNNMFRKQKNLPAKVFKIERL